jgi:hypothetical protein
VISTEQEELGLERLPFTRVVDRECMVVASSVVTVPWSHYTESTCSRVLGVIQQVMVLQEVHSEDQVFLKRFFDPEFMAWVFHSKTNKYNGAKSRRGGPLAPLHMVG